MKVLIIYRLPEILLETKQVINKFIKCDLEELSLSKRSVMTEIWPFAASQRIFIVFHQRSCLSGDACGKVPSFHFTQKIQIISDSATWCIVKKGTFFLCLAFVDCND